MKTKLVSFFFALCYSLSAFAYDAIIDGIYYYLNSTDLTAKVTNETGDYYASSYFGSVVIPSTIQYNDKTYSVTTIGDYAFEYCSGLTSVTIPNSVTEIGESAFSGCKGLTSITIPNSVTTIGSYAFSGCSGLTLVTIPNSVTTIGHDAFAHCSGLTSITIPNSVITIGGSAFYYCKGLTSVTIGSSVTTIGTSAFSHCSGLTSITIPNSVITIGSYAFSGCSGLTSVTIGSSVTTIGSSAFSGCTGLTSVTIPNSVTTIGGPAFSGCSGLTSINVDAANTHYTSVDGVLFNYAQDTLIQYPIGNSRTEYIIPNSVTTIGEYAFYKCSGLSSVTIPNSVTTIGRYAFYKCSGLTLVTIPNSVTTIGDRAFCECIKLTSITIPNSVTTIGEGAFEYCYSLTSVTIPNSVTEIGESAFYFSGLTSVTIPNSVTSIGRHAFHGCSSLISINVDAANTHYTSVDGVLFNYAKDTLIQYPIGNSRTVSVYIIPNSVTTIGDYAFCYCSKLTSITIPNSVTTIGSDAFRNCTNLEKIVCEIEKPLAITDDVFSTYSGILYVPAKGVNRYKLADVWKNFKTILPIQAEEIIVTETQVDPSANIVSIAWRAVENAYNYIIVIKQGEDTICKMTFNAEGQLVTSQYYAPQRAQLLTSTTDAEQTATGWRYVIRDLQEGTEYTYSIIAYDETDKAIDSQSGTFRTLLPSGLKNLTIDKKVGNKFIYGNHLYILRDGNLHTATGARVK